jgi:hypothetical protein
MVYQERICGQRDKSPENSDTTGKIKQSMSPPPISKSSDKAKATVWSPNCFASEIAVNRWIPRAIRQSRFITEMAFAISHHHFHDVLDQRHTKDKNGAILRSILNPTSPGAFQIKARSETSRPGSALSR